MKLNDPDFHAFSVINAGCAEVAGMAQHLLSEWMPDRLVLCAPALFDPFVRDKETNPATWLSRFSAVPGCRSTTLIDGRLRDGSTSLIRALSRALPDARVLSCRSTGSATDPWPIQEFSVMQAGEVRRIVRAMRDTDGWGWYEHGKRQPYEHTSAYSARIKQKRLTRENLIQYFLAEGISLSAFSSRTDCVDLAEKNWVPDLAELLSKQDRQTRHLLATARGAEEVHSLVPRNAAWWLHPREIAGRLERHPQRDTPTHLAWRILPPMRS